MGDSRRRRGATPLVDAAVTALTSPTLEGLLAGVVTTRRVAGDAGVSPGTVSHHFPMEDPTHGETTLARAAAERALARLLDDALEVEDLTLDALEAMGRPDRAVAAHHFARVLAQEGPDEVLEDPDREAAVVSRLLHALAAPHDARARARLASIIEGAVEVRADTYAAALRSLRRRPAHGLTTRDLARLSLALRDGLQVLNRHRPSAPSDLYTRASIALLEALTEPDDDVARLDAISSLLPLPQPVELRGANLERVRRAALSAYADGGWHAVTIARVARRSGVPRATLVARFGDRHGLAALVWAPHVPRIRRATTRARGDAHARMRACLEAIAAAAADDRVLTSAFLDGVFAYTAAHGPPDPEDPVDPRVLVPLPSVIEELLASDPTVLAAEWRSPEGRRDAASMLNNGVLLLSATRPNLEPDEVARRLLTTTYAGMCHGAHGH